MVLDLTTTSVATLQVRAGRGEARGGEGWRSRGGTLPASPAAQVTLVSLRPACLPRSYAQSRMDALLAALDPPRPPRPIECMQSAAGSVNGVGGGGVSPDGLAPAGGTLSTLTPRVLSHVAVAFQVCVRAVPPPRPPPPPPRCCRAGLPSPPIARRLRPTAAPSSTASGSSPTGAQSPSRTAPPRTPRPRTQRRPPTPTMPRRWTLAWPALPSPGGGRTWMRRATTSRTPPTSTARTLARRTPSTRRRSTSSRRSAGGR